MKNIIFTIAGLLPCIIVLAQSGTLTGQLVDEKGVPVRFANVSLLKTIEDAAIATATLTDSAGRFSIVTPLLTGNYFLRFTAVGFSKLEADSISVTGPDFSKNFGILILKTDATTLKDVTVTALRPTITQLADRMVVTIEGSAMAGGNTAYSVLAKSPGVFIDHEGTIQLNGRNGVTIMINGRLTNLSATDLRNMLEGMSAENIKSIELITNPSSKYDAEGTAGMINIVLKKNTFQGMNGSVNTAFSYNFKQPIYSAGGNVNFKKGDWSSFLNLDFNHREGGREATFTRIFYSPGKTTYFDQAATGNYIAEGPPSIRAGTDFDVNCRHSLGGIINFVTNTSHADFLTETYIGSTPHTPGEYIDADNYNINTFRSFTANLHYTYKFDTSGTMITADADYAKITNHGEANFYN